MARFLAVNPRPSHARPSLPTTCTLLLGAEIGFQSRLDDFVLRLYDLGNTSQRFTLVEDEEAGLASDLTRCNGPPRFVFCLVSW